MIVVTYDETGTGTVVPAVELRSDDGKVLARIEAYIDYGYGADGGLYSIIKFKDVRVVDPSEMEVVSNG